MSSGLVEGCHLTPSEQASQRDLFGRPTRLRDDGRRYQWHDVRFETRSVVRPRPALVSVGGDQNSAVVDDALHRRVRRAPRASRLSRRRAASSSRSESAPCSASHSSTAARPSRIRRARRAASVNQAERLTPSASAALRTPAWTSESTVMASLIAGFPRGMANHTTAVMPFQERANLLPDFGEPELWARIKRWAAAACWRARRAVRTRRYWRQRSRPRAKPSPNGWCAR